MGWFSKKKKEDKVSVPYVHTPKYRVVENGLGEFVVQEYEFTGRGCTYVTVKRFVESAAALAYKSNLIAEDDQNWKRRQVVKVID